MLSVAADLIRQVLEPSGTAVRDELIHPVLDPSETAARIEAHQVIIRVQVLAASWDSVLEIEAGAFASGTPRAVLLDLVPMRGHGRLLSVVCTTSQAELFASLTDEFDDAVAKLEAEPEVFLQLASHPSFLSWACRSEAEQRQLTRLLTGHAEASALIAPAHEHDHVDELRPWSRSIDEDDE